MKPNSDRAKTRLLVDDGATRQVGRSTVAVFRGLFAVCLLGAGAVLVVAAPASAQPQTATSFVVTAPADATPGVPLAFTVTAENQDGTTDSAYTGTVHLTSSDPSGDVSLPVDYTFVGPDDGTHIFMASLATAGPQTITVTDAADQAAGSSGSIVVGPTVMIYVDGTLGNDANTADNCSSPQYGACQTIGAAVSLAESDAYSAVTIIVAAAIYHEAVVVALPATDTLAISGAGTSNTSLDDQQSSSDLTISSGVVSVSDFSIVDGSASDGGGVYNTGTATLSDDTLSNDTAADDLGGGAVYNDGAITLTDDTLTNDSSVSSDGGAVYNDAGGTATLSGDTITNDTAYDNNGGGGVYNAGTVTLTDDAISDDSVDVDGGGLYNIGTATLAGDTLSGDSADDEDGGGAIYNTGGDVSLTDDTITNDSADDTNNGGGAIDNEGGGTVTSADDIISDDSADDVDGGAIFNDTGCTVMLNGDTLSDDVAGDGGAIYSFGVLTLTSDTISNDTAGDDGGGGIYNDGGTATSTDDTMSSDKGSNGSMVYNDDSGTVSLDGDTISNVEGEGSGGVVYNDDGNATLSGDTVSNIDVQGSGGVVYNDDGALSLDGGTFDNIQVSASGGVVYNDGGGTATLTGDYLSSMSFGSGGVVDNVAGSITLSDDTISSDTRNNGGVVANDGTATLTEDTISGRSSEGSGGTLYNSGKAAVSYDTIGGAAIGAGGAVDNSNGGTATITYDTIASSTEEGPGGGVYNSGTATIADDQFSENRTGEELGDGGAIDNSGAATIVDDSFSEDSSSFAGGAIYNQGDEPVTIADDTFSNDLAANEGGALFNEDSDTVELSNDTFFEDESYSDDRSGGGGGVFNAGTANLVDDTFTDDTALDNSDGSNGDVQGGGAIDNDGAVTVANSILASDTPNNCAGNPVTDDGYNVADDGTCSFVTGSGSIVSPDSAIWPDGAPPDPAPNGSAGPETQAITSSSSAFGLVPGTACVPGTDERGDPRPGFGNDNCDAGAFELQSVAKLVVQLPSNNTAGYPMSFVVTAEGPSGNTVAGYSGTVQFSSSDPAAILPADATLTDGTGTFTATMETAGTQSVTATDTSDPSLTGSSTVPVYAGPATHLVLEPPTSVTAGTPASFTIDAEDQYGNTNKGYSATLQFTSSDPSDTLPTDAVITDGTGSFLVTSLKAGSDTIDATATDDYVYENNPPITGTSTISVSAAAADRLVVSAPSTVAPGSPFVLDVTATDPYGNTVSGYSGTVHFTSSDTGPGVQLPADYTFTPADSGTHDFAAILATSGPQTVTATDTADAPLNESVSLSVGPTKPIPDVTVFGSPDPDAVTPPTSVVYTVDVTGSGPPPTGSVTVADGRGRECVIASLVAGSGSCHISELTVGSYDVVATYGGDANYAVGVGSTTETVAAIPAASITSPQSGETYSVGEDVTTTFACTEASGGPGVSSCLDSNGASYPSGTLYTSTPGTFTYTVTATSLDGESGQTSISYTVAGAPSATITSPANDQTYGVGQSVPTSFKCTVGPFGPGISSCVDGAGESPGHLDTAAAGTFTYTVTATSSDGQHATASISYTVAAIPAASITSPQSGETYSVGEDVTTTFACTEASGGPGVSSCLDSNGASYPSGTLYTSTPGTFTYTVTATSLDGESGQTSISYTVAGAPSATITSPANDQTYGVGQSVPTSFKCTVGPFGPGISSCVDGAGESPGHLDTAAAGTFTYTVTATSSDGQHATASISYTVDKATSRSVLAVSTSKLTYGKEQVERLSVTVSPQFPGTVPTGTVKIEAGATSLCILVIDDGKGFCILPPAKLAPAKYRLTAIYGGSIGFDASTSLAAVLTVSKAATKTSLTLSTPTVRTGKEQVERLSVTVLPQFAGTSSTGTVTVKAGTTTLCRLTLRKGKGSCVLSASQMSPGSYELVAVYAGSAEFLASTAPRKSLVVTK